MSIIHEAMNAFVTGGSTARGVVQHAGCMVYDHTYGVPVPSTTYDGCWASGPHNTVFICRKYTTLDTTL
jgi:hypothetical protein